MEWTEVALGWKELFEEYRRTGSRRTEFCAERGLKLSTFDYWRSRLKKTVEEEPVVVKVATAKWETEPIRVRVGEQIVVEIDGEASEEQMARVLKAASQT